MIPDRRFESHGAPIRYRPGAVHTPSVCWSVPPSSAPGTSSQSNAGCMPQHQITEPIRSRSSATLLGDRAP